VNHNPANDVAELRALQGGEEAALDRIIARWQRPLFNFAWRYVHNTTDAHDLAMEVFVRLYQHRQQLAVGSNLSAWLFTTLANLCRNHHRWRQRHPTTPLDADAGDGAAAAVPAPGMSPDRALEQDEAMVALATAVARLPHDLKLPLLLYYYEGMPYREIGRIAGCSERGVETRLYRVRQRLRAELGVFLPELTQS